MKKYYFFTISAVLLLASSKLIAQTYSTGKENLKADVNFTELANYEK